MTSTLASTPSWRAFLRGLALEMDVKAGPEMCVALLRGVGQQMARLTALPPVGSLGALEMEMNAALAEIGWGQVRLDLNETERCVILRHTGLPQLGSAGEPPGTWLAPVLEGLYEAWMGQQPGSDDSFKARLQNRRDAVVLRYGRV